MYEEPPSSLALPIGMFSVVYCSLNSLVIWVNPVDDDLKAAGLSADIEVRKTLYCNVMMAIADELPHIYLYDRGEIHATREGLIGYQPTAWQYQTWNIGEWDWVP